MPASFFSAKLSVRLLRNGEKCFGPGAAELLGGIERFGSLRAAAAEMGMAYSNAWTTLRSCEEALGVPLLDRKSGGQSGGSSALTEPGKRLLEGYRDMEARLKCECDSLIEALGKNFP